MKSTGYRTFLLVLVCVISLVFLSGCGNKLRLAPTEAQKQSAVIHRMTVESLAEQVGKLVVQEKLPEISTTLAKNAVRQADAVVAYYGQPEIVPDFSNLEELSRNVMIKQAEFDAAMRPKALDNDGYIAWFEKNGYEKLTEQNLRIVILKISHKN